MTKSHELVVVSGASSGMGEATAVELARRGFHVLAGVRDDASAARLREAGIEPVPLDITEPASVDALVRRVEGEPAGRRLRAVVNCAGLAANGPVETLPLETWRRMFEVNLFGHVAVIQALLPALRRSGGRIVNISSTGGKIAMPAFGVYSATKYALEAMSDALRREVAEQGVQVVVVEPGGVRTRMKESGTRAARALRDRMPAEQRARYATLMDTFEAQVEDFDRGGMTAAEAGRRIADIVTAPRVRARYAIGRDAAIFTRLARLMPDRALDGALASSGRRSLARRR